MKPFPSLPRLEMPLPPQCSVPLGGNGSFLKLSSHALAMVCSLETPPLSPPMQPRYALSGSNSRAHTASGGYQWSHSCLQDTRRCSRNEPSSCHTPLWQTESWREQTLSPVQDGPEPGSRGHCPSCTPERRQTDGTGTHPHSERQPCIQHQPRIHRCGAGVEYMAVAPNGDVFPCHQFDGVQEYRMGNVLVSPALDRP